MKVTNINNKPNQFIIDHAGMLYFQSYQTIIAIKNKFDNQITLDPDWNYSRTTGKYRNIFLNETIKETREKIKAGIHKIENLND